MIRALNFVLIASVLVCGATWADEPPVLEWMKDVQKAKARAAKEGKDLFINFTGSDWCTWCIRLDEEVFSTPTFQEQYADQFIYLYLDFPRRDPEKKAAVVDPKLNQQLASEYGVRGYPSIVLATADGTPYARTGYQRGGAANYNLHLKQLLELTKPLRELVESDEPTPELVKKSEMAINQGGWVTHDSFRKYWDLVIEEDPQDKSGALGLAQAGKLYHFAHPKPAKSVAGKEQGQKIEPPTPLQIYEYIQARPKLSGPVMINEAYTAARALIGQGKTEPAAALLERALADPIVVNNNQAKKMLRDQLKRCQAPTSKPSSRPQ